MNEGTATSGAAGVPEAGLKPESTLVLSEITEPVKKVATLLPVSDEMLEDAPSIQSYLNERLSLFVSIEVERQLLRGNGTNELIGLLNRAGNQAINTYTRIAADDNTVAIAKVIANTRGSANLASEIDLLAGPAEVRHIPDEIGTGADFTGGHPVVPAASDDLHVLLRHRQVSIPRTAGGGSPAESLPSNDRRVTLQKEKRRRFSESQVRGEAD